MFPLLSESPKVVYATGHIAVALLITYCNLRPETVT